MGTHVSILRAKIAALEAEKRFEGASYPQGMSPFPFHLHGQGFFPGGDGLWRDDSEVTVSRPGDIPTGGVLFLGNDFGTLSTYEKLRSRGYEDPWTWRNVKKRVREVGIPVETTFFTNATLGLRTNEKALSRKNWEAMPTFARFCGEFLDYQLAVIQPRLTVVMGPPAKIAFDALPKARLAGQILFTTHPYPDHMNSEVKARSIAELREAWNAVNAA